MDDNLEHRRSYIWHVQRSRLHGFAFHSTTHANLISVETQKVITKNLFFFPIYGKVFIPYFCGTFDLEDAFLEGSKLFYKI